MVTQDQQLWRLAAAGALYGLMDNHHACMWVLNRHKISALWCLNAQNFLPHFAMKTRWHVIVNKFYSILKTATFSFRTKQEIL